VARQTQVIATAQLAFLLGVRAGVPAFEADPDALQFRVPPALEGATAATLERMALDNRPDLQSVRFQQQRAQLNTTFLRRQVFPDIALSLQYSQEGTGQNAIQPPTWVAGVSLPLPLFYQNQGEIARSRLEQKAWDLQRVRAEALIHQDISVALGAFERTRSRVQRMERELLGSALRARDLVQVQYEKGAASLLELLDAQRTYMATQTDYLNNLGDYWTAVFQLEQAVGVEFRRW
jgi:cobalt-zinc-cadmium efflux system outer membrane protein